MSEALENERTQCLLSDSNSLPFDSLEKIEWPSNLGPLWKSKDILGKGGWGKKTTINQLIKTKTKSKSKTKQKPS